MSYDVIAIGASWGGLRAVGTVLDGLSDEVDAAIVVAQHRGPSTARGALESLLQLRVRRPVYVAPADYHLLVERGHFALSTDERVSYARPSIDVLFESVAQAYRERAIGIVLTGANEDGAAGLAAIKARGGVAIVQDPEGAERRTMPDAALALTAADAVLPLAEIPMFLHGLCCEDG
jgi:two-component system chemotaxis response regulator CheB